MDRSEQWQRIKRIVGDALEKSPSQRPAFLREACGTDDALRAEVESLLAASDSSQGLSKGALDTALIDAASVSKAVGPYQLLQKIGEGGMGQVWLAEQTSPVRRKVALKFIKAGMYDDSVLRRFQSEQQSLAIMDHPAIAKVFDAGATSDGQPYFVMEFVQGLPITGYCDQKKMKLRDRLELFIRACEGVQHAHQKAILHRDLKPANILVVEVDGQPTPRIIDFGLAKALSPSLSGQSLNIQFGSFVGTPGYMSPEQADSALLDIDTRADVYSLGVVLYELLTGFLPFDADRWKKQRFEEVLRQMREEDPPRPSTKVGSDRDASGSRARARGTESSHLVSLLRGDLDWITMKAIDKDRNRRYGTPSELAADLRRYLRNEPVVARPVSSGYRLRKYVRRHRLGVAVAAGLALLLAGFAAVQAAQLRRITRERDRANRITDFMTAMFKVSDPSEARGNSITAREILERASKDIDAGLAKDPELQAQMMGLMGQVYGNLGLYARAQSLLNAAVDIRRRVLGPNHPQTLGSMNDLAWNLIRQGHYTEAEELQRETLDARRRVLGLQHPDTLSSMSNLAWALNREARYPEAEKLQRETLDLRRRLLGPDHPDTLVSMTDLAVSLDRQGRFAEAEKLEREALDGQRRVLGTEHPQTLTSMNNLANTLNKQDQYAEAEKLQREALEIERRILGADHPDTVRSMTNLALTLNQDGHYVEAERFEREAVDTQRRVLGPEHPHTLTSMNNLASTLNSEGRYAEAEKIGRETLEIRRRVLGPEHPETLMSMVNLATSFLQQSRYAEAEKLQREALEIQRRVRGPDHPDTAVSVYNLAVLEEREGKREQALKLLHEAINHGLSPGDILGIETDPDLKSLHGDPRFDALVAEARQRAAALQKPK